jgi:hypothetical protein
MVLARWEGRGPRRSFGDDNEASAQTPPPPPCCAGWSPSPTCVGADARHRSRGATGARVACSRCQTAQLRVVARMERSVIRVRSTSFNAAPGFRFAHPGYNPFFTTRFRQRKKGSGTPADAHCNARTQRRAGRATERRLAPPFRFGRARLPAFHRGTCGSDRTPPLSSSSRASWDGTS